MKTLEAGASKYKSGAGSSSAPGGPGGDEGGEGGEVKLLISKYNTNILRRKFEMY